MPETFICMPPEEKSVNVLQNNLINPQKMLAEQVSQN